MSLGLTQKQLRIFGLLPEQRGPGTYDHSFQASIMGRSRGRFVVVCACNNIIVVHNDQYKSQTSCCVEPLFV